MSAAGPVGLAFACGLHFAMLQSSYFFLMEAYVSAQSLAYFVTLLFWLTGFLLGLNLRREGWFVPLLALGVGGYYVTWLAARAMPFDAALYPIAAGAAIGSGALPGYVVPLLSPRFAALGPLLFHENNGFILGLLVSLRAATHAGGWFLGGSPALGAALVLLLFVADGRRRAIRPRGAQCAAR